MTIDTDSFSRRLRDRGVDRERRSILVSRLGGSDQEPDIREPLNCQGYGRIRHFKRQRDPDWPLNPLPLDPVCQALGLDCSDTMRAQVFQNAVCNWRCWYCYVPFDLLSGNPNKSRMFTSPELVEKYLDQDNPPPVIDLSGGQPDLTPEWVPWMMQELRERGLETKTYLWSDDNLSNDYFWRYLSADEIQLVADYKSYGRVCCFKGFDERSFAFNTLADPALFGRQFALMRRFIELGIDLYAYATFTTPFSDRIGDLMALFVDHLQELAPKLPLRTIPLKIEVFTPVIQRLDSEKDQALRNQMLAVEAWQRELEQRFTAEERSAAITNVHLMGVAS